jgi:hypothetical protein
MLGSWNGFKQGLITGALQASYALQSVWENLSYSFRAVWLKVKQWWGGFWGDMETLMQPLEVAGDKLLLKLVNRQREVQGKSPLTEGQQAEVLRRLEQERFAAVEKGRLDSERSTNSELEKLRAEHIKRLVDLGEKSLGASALWAAQKSVLPTLSPNATATPAADNAADTAARAAESSDTSPAGDAAKRQGPKFSAALERGTAGAYSAIVNASRDRTQVGERQLGVLGRILDETKGLRGDVRQTGVKLPVTIKPPAMMEPAVTIKLPAVMERAARQPDLAKPPIAMPPAERSVPTVDRRDKGPVFDSSTSDTFRVEKDQLKVSQRSLEVLQGIARGLRPEEPFAIPT